MENKYKCCICNLNFRREKDLDKHEFQHNGVKKYLCEQSGCSKRYQLKAHLNRHVNTFHKKINNYLTVKCEVESCGKLFSNPYSAKMHLKNFHGKIKKFTCMECNRVFQRKQHLKCHQITHKNEYPFKCHSCEKEFVSEAMFTRHFCMKHSCEDCGERFKCFLALKQHIFEKHESHKCSICNQSFSNKDEFNTHKKIHYTCSWEGCSRSYSNKRNLNCHINVFHLGKKFKCTFKECNKELTSKSRFNRHIQLHEMTRELNVNKKKSNKTRQTRIDAGISKMPMAGKLALFTSKFNSFVEKNKNYGEESEIASETDYEERKQIVLVKITA